jgi:hypothetical protein
MEDSDPFGVIPGDPVPEVNPDDLKAFWHEVHRFGAGSLGQTVGFTTEYIERICTPGTDGRAAWLRASVILALQKIAPERLAPWTKGQEVEDVVFGTMATIPMTWIRNAGQPITWDVEDFFRSLQIQAPRT